MIARIAVNRQCDVSFVCVYIGAFRSPSAIQIVGERGVQIRDVGDPARPRRRSTFTRQAPGTMV